MEKQKFKRPGRSPVWQAFDRESGLCQLPHPTKPGETCNGRREPGSGTSGEIMHLEKYHKEEWLHILSTGSRKPTEEVIGDALAAQRNKVKPMLQEKLCDELHRLVALWIAKCGRPLVISEDKELRILLARILELCQAKFRYTLPDDKTVQRHMSLLGAEAKGVGRDLIVRLLKSSVKPSITGDLWSDHGMALFGIYAHGITETWKMEKALIALVACETEAHTAENIKKWTDEALKNIGLVSEKLLGAAAGSTE